MGFGGVILRFLNLTIRILQFLDSAVILGIFSYFLAALAHDEEPIPQWMRAVEGISGAATLYGLLGAIFTCCIGGVAFFAFVAMVLDVCFVGAMIAVAVLTRNGVKTCQGKVDTPLGTGPSDDPAHLGASFGIACELEKVTFAVAIIGIFFFLVSIVFQLLLARHHKREKRFGPSPANGYTYGTRRRGGWFSRKNKRNPEASSNEDILPGHPTPGDVELNGSEKNRYGTPTGYGYGNSAYTGNV